LVLTNNAEPNVSAGHTSWAEMAVLGGRVDENLQDFREERGVQVPIGTKDLVGGDYPF
jgi:hypothetical protein